MYDFFLKIITESWLVLGQMSPYLLLGFLVAGVLSVALSSAWIERNLGGRGFGSVIKASLYGVPLPLCSCGVIPVSASIRRHGASRAATTAFLLSTPQTGVDSIAITYALLGPVFAVFRPVAAFLTGIVGGALVQLIGERNEAGSEEGSEHPVCTDECCTDSHERSLPIRALHYGFVTLPQDIGMALLLGILIAGVMSAIIPQNFLTAYLGGGILSILLLMAAGVPVYVCATASVPIAAGFMHMGASPGAALAFLIAGPATNAAAFTTMWKVLGRQTAIIYLVTVAVGALGCGLLLDLLVPVVETALPQLAGHEHAEMEAGWLSHGWAVLLLAVMAYSYISKLRKKSDMDTEEDIAASDSGNRLELVITGMTCSHCAESVRRALAEIEGVRSAKVDLKSGQAVVTGDNLNSDLLVTAVSELGYKANVALDLRSPGE